MNWFTGRRESMPDDLERLRYPTRHLAKALEQHASGLRLSLYGLLMILAGLVVLLVALGSLLGPRLDLLRIAGNAMGRLLGPAIMLAVMGSFVNMWGKYRCFEFSIPLSGRWLLNVAIWCDGIMLTARLFSRLIPLLKIIRLAEPLLLVAGLVFFLLFLRSLADVIQRADLKRSVRYVLVALGTTALTAVLFALGAVAQDQMPGLEIPMLAVLSISLVSLVLTTGLYARLLWKMSHGLADFAKYLRAAEVNLDAEASEADDDENS